MKFLFLLVVAAFLGSCDGHKPFNKALLLPAIPECSIIEKDVAEEMIKDFERCNEVGACKERSDIDFNYPDVKALLTILRRANVKVKGASFIAAVYKNSNSYACRVCGGNGSDPVCQVDGYVTMLFKLETEGNADQYIDFATICPPPNGCNGRVHNSSQETNSNVDSTNNRKDTSRQK